eukprot:2016370-Pyramimonas_sp.AAC.1
MEVRNGAQAGWSGLATLSLANDSLFVFLAAHPGDALDEETHRRYYPAYADILRRWGYTARACAICVKDFDVCCNQFCRRRGFAARTAHVEQCAKHQGWLNCAAFGDSRQVSERAAMLSKAALKEALDKLRLQPDENATKSEKLQITSSWVNENIEQAMHAVKQGEGRMDKAQPQGLAKSGTNAENTPPPNKFNTRTT